MKLQLFNRRGLLCAWLLAVLCSCNLDQFPNLDNTYLPKYEGNIAIPIISDTIFVNKLLEDLINDTSQYSIDNDQRIIFSYDFESSFAVPDEFVKVETFSNSKFIESPFQVPTTILFDTVLRISQVISFEYETTDSDEVLDSVFYNSGNFNFTFNTSFPDLVEFKFYTSAFTDINSGDSILVDASVDANGAPPAISQTNIPLQGYKTVLDTKSDVSRFDVTLEAAVHLKSGQSLTGNEYINVEVEVNDPTFDVIFGSFGADTFAIEQQKIDLEFLQDLGGDGIVFAEPIIDINIKNGFGLPVGLDFSNVYALYEGNNDSLFFTGTFPDDPQVVRAPLNVNFGTEEITTLRIDPGNSNLREMIASSPKSMVFDLAGYTNYGALRRNFIDDESSISVDATVSLPLNLRISDFVYEQEYELGDLSDLEGTKSITLLVNAINELPFSGAIDLLLINENNDTTDLVVNQSLIEHPELYDSQGKVIEPMATRTEFTIDEGKVNALVNSTKILLRVKLNSFNQDQEAFVEVYADYTLQIKLGIRGQVSIDIN